MTKNSPLLAESVGREICSLHVVLPRRQMVRSAQWLTAEVTKVDRAANTIDYVSPSGERGALGYDHLVIACGSVVNFNLIPGLAAHAYPLKSVGDQIRWRGNTSRYYLYWPRTEVGE